MTRRHRLVCLGKSCSFGLPRVPFVNCCQFMYLVISLLVLRAGCGSWLYRFLITDHCLSFYFAYVQWARHYFIWWCVDWNRVSFSGETRFALSNAGGKTHKQGLLGLLRAGKGLIWWGQFRGLGLKNEWPDGVLCCHARQFQCIISTTSCVLMPYHFSIIFTHKELKWYLE